MFRENVFFMTSINPCIRSVLITLVYLNMTEAKYLIKPVFRYCI